MPPDTPRPLSSFEDRRAYYRINIVLPICLQAETDTAEGEFIEKTVNLSGGGIGVTGNVSYTPGEILSVTLRFPDEVVLKACIEVLNVDPIPYPANAYRMHARFIRMNAKDQELLIGYVMRFQRDHLQKHYLA